MCHWLKFMMLRRSIVLYDDVLSLPIKWVVDKTHFRGHSKDDTFCQTKCNPDHYAKELDDQNSQACEQTNRCVSPVLPLPHSTVTVHQPRVCVQVVWSFSRHHAPDDAQEVQVFRLPHVRAAQ